MFRTGGSTDGKSTFQNDYTYRPTCSGYLLAKRRLDTYLNYLCKRQYDSVTSKSNFGRVQELIVMEPRYPFYNFTDLASHCGIVHLPYKVSFVSFFEQYRMNIPIFFPSQQLLLLWNAEHRRLRDNMWARQFEMVQSSFSADNSSYGFSNVKRHTIVAAFPSWFNVKMQR